MSAISSHEGPIPASRKPKLDTHGLIWEQEPVRFLTILVLVSLTSLRLSAQTTAPTPAPTTVDEHKTTLSYIDATTLGLVEGITEFLPISSTGHLIITNELLQLNAETPLTDAEGQPLWYKKPKADFAGEPLTLKLAADTYAVVIQAGAIAAVLLVFWSKIQLILAGLVGRSSDGLRLLRNIIVACIPAVVIGLALESWIDDNLFSVPTVIAALIVGAGLMFVAERWRRRRDLQLTKSLELADLSIGQSLTIGGMQCLALWPGMSRSMSTMVGGYWVGLTPARAAEFSFLVGLPILTGAAALKTLKAGPAMLEVFGWGPVVVGCLVAAVSAAVAVKFLVHYLTRHGLEIFAVYRVVIAGLLIWWMLR